MEKEKIIEGIKSMLSWYSVDYILDVVATITGGYKELLDELGYKTSDGEDGSGYFVIDVSNADIGKVYNILKTYDSSFYIDNGILYIKVNKESIKEIDDIINEINFYRRD